MENLKRELQEAAVETDKQKKLRVVGNMDAC